MDEVDPSGVAGRRAPMAPWRPTTPWPGCAASPSPTSASPGSTTTAPCARDWPRRSTPRARNRRRCSAIVGELLAAPGRVDRCCVSRVDDAQADGRPGRQPGRHPPRRPRWCGGPLPERAERIVVVTAGTADLPVADECAAVLGAHGFAPGAHHRRRRGRACTACSTPPTSWPRPTPSSWWPAWRGRWPAWSAASPAPRSSPCPPAPATAPRLEGVTALLAMLALVRVGHHRGRHRQRLRRRLRHRPPLPGARSNAACLTPADRPSPAPGGLVPLLLRHRRGHGPGRARRRRRRPRRGAPAAASACRSAAGRSRPRRSCAPASAAPRSTCAPSPARWCAPPPTSPAWSRRPACPSGCAGGRWPRSTRWPGPRATSTAARPRASTSTRSAASTPSSTWSAPAPPSRCSASTRSTPARWPTASAWCAAPTACCPIPAPAVVELLRGAPTYQLDVPVELTTPTGAALLAALVTEWGPMPAMTIDRTGFGAGTADLGERPNLTQVVIGERVSRAHRRPARGAARGQRRRRHRRDAGPRRRRAAGGRGARRLDHADRDEEGPARLHRERAGRPGPGRPGRRRAHRRDGVAGGAGPDPRALAPGADRRARRRRRTPRPGQGQRRSGEGRTRRRGAGGPPDRDCPCARSCRGPRRRGARRARMLVGSATAMAGPRPDRPGAPAPLGHLHDGHNHDHED